MIDIMEKFDGVYNFRDLGGLETENGQRMRNGVLFRSDELSRLSPRDIAKINELDIKMICDLRTASEQKSKPSRIKANSGIQLVHVSINDKSWEITHMDFFKFMMSKSSSIDFEVIMKDMYQYMAFDCQNEIKRMFELLANEKNLPALIHCTGGKDRTGFISSLLQMSVGVPYEAVTKQYLHSNELIGPRMKKMENTLKWITLFRLTPEKLKPVLEVRQEYLDHAYSKIFAKYDTIHDYLREECHISDETLHNVKEALIED
ncbi:tyrosine-protein phosphatase [Cytobacillus purgationiresistens]|uniref:Protein-tyrosine phosphatase n=1 Tax=Cytobacillus purgationiresistens TaxID=863449 RepID=A0ABU0ANB5_9BACI|nr:tyrosine-protein phosphatase [Cytobacillus purgationiresistens]MDQ0272771.1 protein-tyrosine phosphatase [Cytobacillus purgationiresistens]